MNYHHTLKFVKNNKCLLNHLGINIVNYKQRKNYQCKIAKQMLNEDDADTDAARRSWHRADCHY